MKYWILAVLGLVAGTAAGYFTTQFTQANIPEYFSISYYPDGAPQEVDIDSVSVSGPRVSIVNGEVHEFGSMEKNETKSHTFKLRNVGEKPLELELVGTTCKCTVGELGQSQVAPQETIDIVLEWKPLDYSRTFSQSATLKTNDPRRSEIELRVEGRVVQPVWAAPETLVFTNVVASEGAEAEFQVFSSDPGLELQSIALADSLPDDWMHVSSERLPADSPLLEEQLAADGFTIRVKVDGGLPLEPISRTVQLQTNRTPDGPLEVDVKGAVRGDISINVPKVSFDSKTNLIDLGLIDSGVAKELQINLILRGKQENPVKMWIPEGGVTPVGSMIAELEEPRQLSNLQITSIKVTIPADAEPVDMLGPTRDKLGRIEILTDHETDKRIVVYVRFAVPG